VRSVQWGACVLGASIITLFVGCAHQQKKPHITPIPIQTTWLHRGDITTYEQLDGHISPYLQANIATEQAGSVIAVYANEGDRVFRGEPLAKLDDRPLQAQLVQAHGSNVQAQAHLAQSVIEEPITITSSQGALEQAKTALQQSKQQLASDEAAVAQTSLTYTADQRLFNQGYVSESIFRQAQAAYVADRQMLSIDQGKVAQAEAALHIAQQNIANIALQRQVIAENQGSVQSSIGQEQLLKTQISQTTLQAPFDGWITQRLLDPGAYASQNQPIFTLAQIDPVYVDFSVHDTDLAILHPGTPVFFTVPAIHDRRYTVPIASIDAVPQSGTLMYHTRLIVANHDGHLRGGMLVTVAIMTAQHRHVFVVPRSAVTQESEGATIYRVVRQDKTTVARRILVRTGLQTNSSIEVSGSGLRPGMQILANHPDNVDDGSVVAP